MDMTIIAALILIAVVGALLAGWGMWLEHRRQGRVLDIVAAAIAAGQEPPEALLAGLAGAGAVEARAPRKALRRTAAFFVVVALACFLGSWAVHDAEREQALLMVTGITGLVGIGLLAIERFGQRLGL